MISMYMKKLGPFICSHILGSIGLKHKVCLGLLKKVYFGNPSGVRGPGIENTKKHGSYTSNELVPKKSIYKDINDMHIEGHRKVKLSS